MNKYHLEMLSSRIWAEMLERDLLPWIGSVGEFRRRGPRGWTRTRTYDGSP